ncbi:MFS transporter [Rouxiella badensis]|jgi:MHS family shikimate/dehydroshikimate transporter-like MFS transporter|uniref:MFS transporter n=1 Tax=Rouxiella badensis TaxID=1646377 RepID=A0A1X0WI96_9GAMM|nr:MFS transporter [Rouxiella badensis]MCC3704095.1 MHS family MFS transporter [Rouxiella badensis]MCC3733750.1 MHS family MFS transporter [Rouxiella badensis]MCC3759597.1 MHS family MFS transporter [Rouxiella badensis]ORJ26507.1 MFS transporter [Rouxiella badensis]QII38079.1 MHS family MFS transporter [Rouxiella badensis]
MTQVSTSSQAAMSQQERSLLKRVAGASAIGTAAEYYDFFAYGTAAVLFFGQLFFPSSDPLVSTLAAFATYAVGFLARPLGGIVFGHIGDKVGRKKALVITILIVGLGTFCIGLLPTYEKIGFWAPVLLILIRVLQGFGVGGEQAGAVLMTAEYSRPERRGFFASWVQIGAPLGFLLPSALFAVLNSQLSAEQMLAWGWRIPFLISLLLVIIGLFIRLRIDESPVFAEIRKTKAVESRPVIEVIRRYPGIIVKGVCAKLIEACAFAMFTVIVLAFGKANHLSASVLLDTMIVAVILEIISIPLMGKLSDKVGRRPVYMAGTLLLVIGIVPFFLVLKQDTFWMTQIAMILALTFGHSMCYAPQASYFPELFPTRIRCSGIALIWQIGSLIGSGVLGLVAVKILQATGGDYHGLAIYMIVLGIISFIGLMLMPETAPGVRGSEYHSWGEKR